MKKIIYLFVVVFIFTISLTSVSAQTVTKNDIVMVAPQLASALNNLSIAVSQRQSRFNNQNIALNGIVGTLGSIVNTVANVDSQNLSTEERAELNLAESALAGQIGLVSNVVGNIVNERNNFNQVLGGVVNILGSISNTIANAV